MFAKPYRPTPKTENLNLVSKIKPKNMSEEEWQEKLKLFKEKREARQKELQAKVSAKRDKKPMGNDTKKPDITKTKSKSLTKLPVVRQTLASKLRMEKANPLLTLEHLKNNVTDILKETDKKEKTPFTPNNNQHNHLNDKHKKSSVPTTYNKPNLSKVLKKQPQPENKSNKIKTLSAPSQNNSIKNKNTSSNKNPLRRSLTTVHLKHLGRDEANKCIKIIKSHSVENISTSDDVDVLSPINETEEEPRVLKNVTFFTPSRRSMHHTSFTPAPSDLRERLQKWLQKRGKSLDGFQHLRCFGVHRSTPFRTLPIRRTLVTEYDEENKENIETLDDYDEISIEVGAQKVVDYTNGTTNEDIFGTPDSSLSQQDSNRIINDLLNDLHKLILEKYPREQCEAWLSALKKKYPNITENPLYWECRAALEEINEEITLAVECYQKAIIHGAEVHKIDQSIEQLLEKFSLIKIDSNETNVDPLVEKRRAKTVLDARNVFKSSVIKFAVQQREVKKLGINELKFIATPVRRSTRLSRSSYLSTPTIKIYDTLRDVSSPVKSSMVFCNNSALH